MATQQQEQQPDVPHERRSKRPPWMGLVNLNADKCEQGWIGKRIDMYHEDAFLFDQPV